MSWWKMSKEIVPTTIPEEIVMSILRKTEAREIEWTYHSKYSLFETPHTYNGKKCCLFIYDRRRDEGKILGVVERKTYEEFAHLVVQVEGKKEQWILNKLYDKIKIIKEEQELKEKEKLMLDVFPGVSDEMINRKLFEEPM